MSRLADLHCHSHYSDGTSYPDEIAKAVKEKGVELWSLTDHDTLKGAADAASCAKEYNIKYINGVEISTNGHDFLHILGYNIDINNQELKSFLEFYRQRRAGRVRLVVENLQKSGLDITYEEVQETAKGVLSRPHVADLLKKKKYAHTRQEAFRLYLTKGCCGYVPPMGCDIEDAFKVITKAGGFPVLAHPGVCPEMWNFALWKEMGLKGVEVFYPAHTTKLTKELLGIAKQYDLLPTAGSDYHGPSSGREKNLGMHIPDENFKLIEDTLYSGVR